VTGDNNSDTDIYKDFERLGSCPRPEVLHLPKRWSFKVALRTSEEDHRVLDRQTGTYLSTMSNEPASPPTKPHLSERSDSSSSSDNQEMHAPIPLRPRLVSRKSSGTLIVPRDSCEVGPIEHEYEADDVRAMSPRRTSEDLENLGREAREELHR
jgi:hypothetical protein